MRVLLTGAGGFLGWHTRVRLRALTDSESMPVTRERWSELDDLTKQAEAVIHVAGVNRSEPEEVERGNRMLAEQVAEAVRSAEGVARVVYANSTQVGNGTVYGLAKQAAGEILAQAAEDVGAAYVDVRLPNLFGEHGRPDYNSFVATFVDAVVRGATPVIQDRDVALLHVQDAAQLLLDGLDGDTRVLAPPGTAVTVQRVYELLRDFQAVYRGSDVPALSSKFEVDLFNTFRARLFPKHYPMALTAHSDQRGRLVESVRVHGGEGQTFVSSTRPGHTRGDHFHLNKVERFAVVSGQARISLRQLFGTEVFSFDVTGDEPAAVDMPTMWAHNITNTGSTELTTLFWTHTLFDPLAPDTYAEKVVPERQDELC